MANLKKTTVYLDDGIYNAVRVKAQAERRSISAVVSAALRELLQEDADDLRDAGKRKAGPFVSYERVLKKLKKDGVI